MEVTVIHKSDLNDYLYDFYYLPRQGDNILPGSLLELSQANKFEFVPERKENQSAKDYYHNELEEQINLTNFEVVCYLLSLAKEEFENSGDRYWFIDPQAWQLLLEVEKLIMNLYQHYNFCELDFTDQEYEELVEDVVEILEVIQNKVRKAYELAVTTYIAQYKAMFG